MRDAARWVEKGATLAAERWEDEALRQDKLRQMREAVLATRARANAAYAVWRKHPTTLRQVRLAVFDEDDTDYYAK
jgi:hypothetical protein